MRSDYLKTTLKAAIFAVTVLLLTAGVSAQTVVLTASPQTTVLPDGNTVPMWGWTCGTGTSASSNFGAQLSSITVTTQPTSAYTTPVVNIGAPQVPGGTQATATVVVSTTGVMSITITNPGSGYITVPSVTISDSAGTGAGALASATLAGTANCTALTYTAAGAVAAVPQPQIGGTVWQPPLIVVPYVGVGTSLTINLTNTLPVETSLVIIGQAGGGLGAPVREAGPRADGDHSPGIDHSGVQCASLNPNTPVGCNTNYGGPLPGQTGTTWTTVVPGSFTPPTQGERARTFTSIEVPGVATVGATPAAPGVYSWTNLQPGTYLIRTGTYPSIQGPMGLYGVLVVTQAPTGTAPGLAYPVPAGQLTTGVTYDADVVALESEIDPRQNGMVDALFPKNLGGPSQNTGFSETRKWSPNCGAGPNGLNSAGQPPTCYPPAVDYTPKYFLMNGVAFSKDNLLASALSVPAAASTGNVLVRYVNAGSHMHVPTVNGLNMLLVAEDGYVLPDIALALTTGKTLTANNPPVGNQALGLRIQNEVFQAAGKVFDVILSPPQTTAITPPTFAAATYTTWDRSLALATNGLAINGGGGMQAILDVNDASAAKLSAIQPSYVAKAVDDQYAYAPGVAFNVSDPGKGVIANDVNVYGVQLLAAPGAGTVTLYSNGTFTYTPTGSGADSFTYCANGTVTALVCSSGITATVRLNMSSTVGTGPTANPDSYTSPIASIVRVAAPGVLLNDVDPNGYPMTAVLLTQPAGVAVQMGADGSFTATKPATTACNPCTFTYQAKNSQNSLSNIATVTLNFLPPSNLNVLVQDAQTKAAISDYKWIIEQDLTLHIDPACQVNTGSATIRPTGSNGLPCPALPAGSTAPPTPATQFHTSYYPVIATGCTGPQSCGQGQTVYDAGTPCTGSVANTPPGCSLTAGQHVKAACDGYGICTIGANTLPMSMPSDANLSATNPDGTPASYFISILSGDAANAFNTANVKDPSIAGNCAAGTEPTGIAISTSCGHTMGGSPISPAQIASAGATPVIVNLELAPLKTATVTAYVFEDDYPLNGEPDAGGGIDVIASNEPGLGDFQIEIWDDAGGIGDFTGQMTYDTFNVPLTNALNGTMDPSTGFDACPISKTAAGVGVGVIVVCPKFESDGKTLSPLTGQAVVKNLMQGKYSLIAHPGAVREANGEEWLQTNSLDGGHFLDSFIRVGEPAYFQEYGPGGYHVFFGMANPKIINARLAAICAGTSTLGTPFAPPCRNNLNGQVANLHQGRSPNENLSSGAVFAQGDAKNYAPFTYTNCYAAIGDSDGATIALAKCDQNGNFSFTNLPDGNYGIVIFDQWDDFIVDGSSRPVNISGGTTQTLTFPTFTWQAHLWNTVYMDTQGLGAPVLRPDGSLDPVLSPGLIQVPVKIRQRNGKFVNTLFSDIAGNVRFNETFPLFAFYTVESDTTRFRSTGVHVVNDAGGAVDGPTAGGGNGNVGPYQGILNSQESFPLPADLQYPGSVYCASAACPGGFATSTGTSTGRIDPGNVTIEAWQGGVSEFEVIDWGKTPYISGENGGIKGHVVYASTRPFDDPRMNFQNLWDPLVPNVTINLYQEGTAPDGTTSLTLVDTTQTSSWDAYAQGVRMNANGTIVTDSSGVPIPNLSCTGQDPADPFFSYTMAGTRNYLSPNTQLPHNSQYKCYDGYHNLNQLQPATYDGLYQFPSQACLTGTTFTLPVAATATTPATTQTYNCATVTNPAAGQVGAAPKILPSALNCLALGLGCNGKYVTEIMLPPNWELNKEEDLNLLIGDQYIAPAVAEFGSAGLGNIFITPDQASIDAANPSYTGPYTPGSPYNQPFNCTGPGAVAGNASTCAFTPNTTNNGKQAGDYGRTSYASFGPGGVIQQSAPCVGLLRVVPDYLSISPESGQVAPFAGYTKNLCDRKEITLDDQMQADADFFIWTKVPKAVAFTGFISDDFSSEFDPAAPAFGEKFAIPNVPVSFKDFNGIEVSRVYSDQWGTYNGLTYGSWEVDVPNITGYSPNMMITCMNDPGPIIDTRAGSATLGQLITDPYYNPAYSNFCYENPFMPGDTTYLDTPVIPTSAFAEGYNPPDCAYADGTPAISEVDGDGVGPWVSAAGHNLVITALGPQLVPNNAYSGPAATSSPYNLKFITRNYNFGTAPGTVTIGGVPATVVGAWSPTTLTVQVPVIPAANSTCKIQQRNTLAGTTAASCGELVITTAPSPAFPNGQQSIDTVTVTIGGKAPTHVLASGTIQSAIDAAAPGDLIIVDPTCTALTSAVSCTTSGATHSPSAHNELLLMWKPVRLQGVAAASSILNGNTHPSGKLLDPWRKQVNCLFGLATNGQPYSTAGHLVPLPGGGGFEPLNAYDPTGASSCPGTGWNSFAGGPNNPQVDRLPLEGIVGWDTTVNGNLAEMLQEPSLMGAYEGAAITVLGKGVRFPAGVDVFGSGPDTVAGSFIAHESQMPVPTIELSNSTADCNDYPSNFQCNPSSIDGLGITNSSQGGGGIFVHAWGHNLQIANNRISNNGGTLAGGITVGQGESGDALISGNNGDPVGYNGGTLAGFDQQPWTCLPGAVAPAATPYGYDQVVSPPGTYAGQQLPYCYNLNLNVHHNSVTNNASYGDELFSATPGAGGGIAFCTGSDYYDFDYNWVCGNLSTGDGGGLAHLGFSYNGDIEHNSFLFNQSFNPTLPTHGGGVIILGAAPDGTPANAAAGTECGSTSDADCAPGLSDGTGPGLVINANLFQGNTAESGSGGGIEFEHINGTDVQRFPNNPSAWYEVTVENNIFANNVAGWTGGGVSLHDAVKINFRNNTVVSNDTTASAGVLFDSLGAPNASQPPYGCDPVHNPNCTGNQVTTSTPQPAGLSTERHSANFLTAFSNPNVACPAGHEQCTTFSKPMLLNNLFWQNRAFNITAPTGGAVQLNPALSQTATGACPSGAYYWDIGVYTDTAPNNHGSGLTLQPNWSVLTDAGDYPNGHNIGFNPNVVGQFCNGSRVPPEIATQLCTGTGSFANAPGCIQPGTLGVGITVPSGVPDSVPPPLPVFTLTPAATVDEGNNWINMFYGPLSLTNPTILSGGTGYGVPLGNYSPNAGSPIINVVPISVGHPATDFFGNPRPDPANPDAFDIGAVELQATSPTTTALARVSPTSLTFSSQLVATTSAAQIVTVSNDGTLSLALNSMTFTGAFNAGPGSTCAGALAAGTFCTINVRFAPTAAGAQTGTLVIATSGDPANPTLTVTLSGLGTSPVNSVLPASLTFNTPLNIPSASQSVTVTNNGTAPLTLNKIAIGGTNPGQFSQTNTCGTLPATLAIGASCTINARFLPTTASPNPKTASLNVNAAAPATSASVALTGNVLAPSYSVAWNAPGTGAFGNQLVGTRSATQTATVTNTSTNGVLLVVNAVGKNGTSPGQWTAPTFVTGCATLPATLPPGGSCTVSVAFSPTSTGAKSTNLTFTLAAPATSPATLPMTGTGVQGAVSFSGPSPSLVTGTSTAHNGTITVTNTGSGPVTLTAAPTVTKTAGPGTFTIVAGGTCVSGFAIASGSATCTIIVQYNPGGVTTTSSALVSITDTGVATGGGAATQKSAPFTGN